MHSCWSFLSFHSTTISHAEHQQTWYQNHKKQDAEYNKCSEYQESHKKSQKKYRTNKCVKLPPNPPSTQLCQSIISDYCVDTSPEVFEEAGCAVCGKLTAICEMEEISEVENIHLLKIDGVTRKARSKSSDPVRELRSKALHWLKLNHVDYYDCEISNKNLASYQEEGPPASIKFK